MHADHGITGEVLDGSDEIDGLDPFDDASLATGAGVFPVPMLDLVVLLVFLVVTGGSPSAAPDARPPSTTTAVAAAPTSSVTAAMPPATAAIRTTAIRTTHHLPPTAGPDDGLAPAIGAASATTPTGSAETRTTGTTGEPPAIAGSSDRPAVAKGTPAVATRRRHARRAPPPTLPNRRDLPAPRPRGLAPAAPQRSPIATPTPPRPATPGTAPVPAPRTAGDPPATPALPAAATTGRPAVVLRDTPPRRRAPSRIIERGLRYLAERQGADGAWGSQATPRPKYGQVFVGKTGLCLLAFLGAGHTPTAGTVHAAVAGRAVAALLRSQRPSGHFGRSTAYSHGIATYALAECLALTGDERLRAPLQRAVDWILHNQNIRTDAANRGGWGYYSDTLAAGDPFSRTATTCWQVMALEAARQAGLPVPAQARALARSYLLGSFDREHGYFLYNRDPARLRSEWRTLPASTPATVLCLRVLGVDAADPRVTAGLDYTVERRPTRYRRHSTSDFTRRGAGNPYFWYYGTLACYAAGGDHWTRWREALLRVLRPAQVLDGSFPAIGRHADEAGDTADDRAFTTALCLLSLQIHFAHLPPLLER